MCGIAALDSRREPVSATTLERATKSLYHRGPDGQRQWISADRKVGLGHARLSIIDLSTGDQPIASEDERTRMVVNGEFYGFEAIQKELEGRGHRLRTRSYADYAAEFRHELEEAVRIRLRADVPVGVYLSGGLDSCAVFGLAA
jgi:asparagine synthase (glutamine-hydrolysing)